MVTEFRTSGYLLVKKLKLSETKLLRMGQSEMLQPKTKDKLSWFKTMSD